MPQMGPLMWLILFLAFAVLLIITSIKIYFVTNKKLLSTNKVETSTKTKLMNWMW